MASHTIVTPKNLHKQRQGTKASSDLTDPMPLDWLDNIIPEKLYCIILTGGYQTHLYQHDIEILKQALNAADQIIPIGEKVFFREHIVFMYPVSEE